MTVNEAVRNLPWIGWVAGKGEDGKGWVAGRPGTLPKPPIKGGSGLDQTDVKAPEDDGPR